MFILKEIDLEKRYQRNDLVPFAKRGANDDIACFNKKNNYIYILYMILVVRVMKIEGFIKNLNVGSKKISMKCSSV